MTLPASLPVKKMNGLGNAFVVLDARGYDPAVAAAMGLAAANRRSGFDCDQLIVIERSGQADAFMRIFNADGSEVVACGNAARCVAWLLSEEKGRSSVVLETRAGLLAARVDAPDRIIIDMGEPRFDWAEIPLRETCEDTRAIALEAGPIDGRFLSRPSVVNIGNPHAIFWVDDVAAYDLARFGPLLETDPIFPERANISLAHVLSRAAIDLRTWERGAGLTKACGTAACAAAVAAARMGLTDRAVTVRVPGGSLAIRWTGANRVLMTGPAELEWESEFVPENDMGATA